MRKHRTEDEQRCVLALIQLLQEKGKDVTLNPDICDRPDAVLSVDGRVVAVECTNISPESVMQAQHHKFKGEHLTRCIIPLEPHMWIKYAIEGKSKNHHEYRQNADSDEVWLLCHFKDIFTQRTHSETKKSPTASYFLTGLTYGVLKSNNPFDRVVVVLREGGADKAITVYNSGNYCIDPEALETVDYPGESMPVDIWNFGPAQVVDLGDGKVGIRNNLNSPNTVLALDPLDDRYYINRSEFEAIDFANIGRGHNYPKVKAYRRET